MLHSPHAEAYYNVAFPKHPTSVSNTSRSPERICTAYSKYVIGFGAVFDDGVYLLGIIYIIQKHRGHVYIGGIS